MNMLEACGAALESKLKLPRWLSTTIVGAVVFGVSVFLESLSGMGSWLDLITIYVAPFGAVLGLDPIKKELMLGRDKPIGKAFDFIAKYVYVILSAAVVIFGIIYGGIG